VQCVETTSMGRLFDAVAALVGLAERNLYEGHAGLVLEAAVTATAETGAYPLPLAGEELDWRPLIAAVYRDRRRGVAANDIAARFHNALAQAVLEVARATGARQVALSGGCFQNVLLTMRTAALLEAAGIALATHQRVPANDGGLALGQAVLAAHRK
jgi:hydrogenase maturation protein HypF